jgi:proteasome assembly chaperone (PAC2) family protein
LEIASTFNVKRIIGFGGVYGEIPYDKERMISCTYSLVSLKDEVRRLSVNLSDYHGGASIGSFICRRAADLGLEYISFYVFVPTYDFSSIAQVGSSIRIEHDYKAWLGIMQRVNYLLKLDFDLTDLGKRSHQLVQILEEKIQEIIDAAPEAGIREYLEKLSAEYVEVPFAPLDDVWETKSAACWINSSLMV